MQSFWIQQGFCQQAIISRSDYIEIKNKHIYGNFWRIKSCNKININKLQTVLKEHGFTISHISEHKLKGWKKEKNTILYFIFNSQDEEPLILLQQKIFNVGDEFTINTPSNGNKIYFYLNYPKERYLSMEAEILNHKGTVDIEAEGYIRRGKLKEKINYSRKINGKEGINYILDLPISPGLQLWSVSNNYGNEKLKIKFKIKEEGKIIPTKREDKIGGIILKNVPYGNAKVFPEQGVEYNHKNLPIQNNYTGELTPQGNIIFWLPSGYWQLQVYPFQKQQQDTLIHFLKAHLIPVFPGHLTEVNWPASLTNTFNENDGLKLEIIKIGQKNNLGFLDFSLINLNKTKIEPKTKELEIVEAGLKTKVLKIERISTPPQIVILIDSSGSMKGSMKKASSAVKTFLQGLPKVSIVTLIDFDNKPKIISHGNPAKVIKSLSKIKANGATALYDALDKGISILAKTNRPTLILFTDGKDANWNDTGPGSRISQKEIFNRIKNINFPIFTIGFGKNPDFETLTRIANVTGGSYYSAHNIKDLSNVFKTIRNNLGNQWRVYYQLPKKPGISNKPVLSLVIDNSGSMEGKIERVRNILYNFISSLPNDFLIQLSTFSDQIFINQVLTNNKQAIFRGLAEMKDLSGTEILKTLKSSYKLLHAIPSSQRYLVYLTDEALEESDQEKQTELKLILKQLKDDGVKSLFIGMLEKDKKGVFKKSAKLSGGEYVISPNLITLQQALNKLAEKINKTNLDDKHIVRLVFKHTDKYGRTSLFSAAKQSPYTLPTDQSMIKNPEVISWRKGEKLRPYDGELAKLITGDDAIGREVQVLKRIPLNVGFKNKAVKITLKEAVFLSKLRGVKPPRGRFMAVTLKLEDILKPQKIVVYPNGSNHPAAWVSGSIEKNARIVKKIPDYLIPEVKLHFFLEWNNKTSFPVSDATYLAETPLILPGENEIYIRPGKPIEGTLIFIVPDEFMAQSGLHFYDTIYGHIDIPISGTLTVKKEQITLLPKTATGKLSDTFSIEVKGFQDTEKIYENQPEENNIYRILEFDLLSKVQAHLAINPKKRFFLAIDTPKGPFIFTLHPITQRIPLGLYRSRLITPGSPNKARLVFEIPKKLANNPFKLIVDIKGGGLDFPIIVQKLSSSPCIAKANVNEAELCINNIYKTENNKEIIIDTSIKDIKDNASTAINLNDLYMFILTPKAQKKFAEMKIQLEKGASKSKGLANFGDNVVKPVLGDVSPITKDFLVVFPQEVIILDGKSRRGLVFFPLHPKANPSDFILKSSIFKNLSLPLPVNLPIFSNTKLLTRASSYEDEDSAEFKESLEKAIGKLTQIRQATNFVKPGSIKLGAVTLDGEKEVGLPIKAPNLLTGAKTWKTIKTLQGLKNSIKDVKLKASNWEPWQVVYSPEAVLTQGWMTENELAFMVEKILHRQLLETTRLKVQLTKKGTKNIKNYFVSPNIDLYSVPAIQYEDNQGINHILVIPFLKDIQELSGMVKQPKPATTSDAYITLEVAIKVRPLSSGRADVTRELSNALAGGSSEDLEEIVLLIKKFKLPTLSLGPVSLGFAEVIDRQKGKIIKAVLDSPAGRKIGKEVIELAKYQPVQICLRFYTPQDTYQTIRDLKNKEWPTDHFFVIGLNVPDLPENKLKDANSIWKKKYAQAKNPDLLSSLKWLGQGIIARFVGAQTKYNAELAKKLQVETVYIKQPKILVSEFKINKDKNSTEISLDIVQPYPEIRGENKAKRRFNLLAGFYYSNLEAKAVPNGINTFKLLSLLPNTSKLLLFSPEDNEQLATILKENGYPRFVWSHIKKTNNFIFFPDTPLVLKNNQIRVAWFEIEPDSQKVWTYLDSGEKGVVDTQIGEGLALSLDYMMGFWIGVQNSVWSTAGFSLVLTDWNKIKTCAHGFARRLGEYLEKATQPIETLKPDASKIQVALSGDVKGAIGISSLDYGCMGTKELKQLVQEHASNKAWTREEIQNILESSKELKELATKSWNKAKEKYLGFANGYKDGVDWYFR